MSPRRGQITEVFPRKLAVLQGSPKQSFSPRNPSLSTFERREGSLPRKGYSPSPPRKTFCSTSPQQQHITSGKGLASSLVGLSHRSTISYSQYHDSPKNSLQFTKSEPPSPQYHRWKAKAVPKRPTIDIIAAPRSKSPLLNRISI